MTKFNSSLLTKDREMKKILSVIIVLLLAGIARAQEPYDPGIRDTVRFGNWGVYLPCPPCSGTATIPIFVYNDEYIERMYFNLKYTGPIELSAVEFTPVIDIYFGIQIVEIDTSNNEVTILLVRSEVEYFLGSRNIGYLFLAVKDTGMAMVDTVPDINPGWDPKIILLVTDLESGDLELVLPSFNLTEVHLTPQNVKPGDANGDGSTSITDIVYLVNYLFKNGPNPVYGQMTDVNVDCVINIEDLVYLVNFIFKVGPKPLPGCSE